MSIEFLQSLNGHNRGALRNWLDRLDHEPRIAWYPSAGEDFRDLMYLQPAAPARGSLSRYYRGTAGRHPLPEDRSPARRGMSGTAMRDADILIVGGGLPTPGKPRIRSDLA